MEKTTGVKLLDKCTDSTTMEMLQNLSTEAPTLVRQDNLQSEVDRLSKLILHYEQDSPYHNYFAWNRKANETAEALNSFTLSLTGDDKTFERYLKLIPVQEQVNKIVDALRKDYLKLDEEKLREVERTGVPMIEKKARQHAKK